MVALASVTPGTGGWGRRAHRPPGCGGTSRAAPPCAQPSARCLLAHARVPARANYRVPELRAVHPRTGQARAPRASPSAGSEPSLMFPRSGRPVDAAQPPPRRARATGLAVGAQPGAQRSPCVRPGGPDGTSGLGARGGDAHSSYFRSPMSRPARPPTPEAIGRRRGWPPCGGRSQCQAHPGGHKARVWAGARRRRPNAAAHSADGSGGGLAT